MSLPLQVLMQYRCYSIRLYFHYQSHPQLGIVFALALLFCFGSISSFFLELFHHSSPVAYWAPTDLGSSPFSVLFFFSFLLFHTVHGVLKARILKWFAIPCSSGPHSVRPLHHDLPVFGGPTGHGLASLS